MKEFEEVFAASKSPVLTEAKVGFAAIQEMARIQEQEQKQEQCDLSFLRFDPASNRMTLESSTTKSPNSSAERPAKFPLEIPTPVTSPNLGHKLRKMGSWRLDLISWLRFLSVHTL